MNTALPQALSDHEFGRIRLRTVANAKHLRLRLRPDGSLSITMPRRASLRQVTRFIEQSRPFIRANQQKLPTTKQWQHGDKIGHAHILQLQPDQLVPAVSTTLSAGRATVLHNPEIENDVLQQEIHSFVKKLLRKQASAYLPRRLQALATQHNFAYAKLRFSNAETRWGSCSQSGTISLNIWLMTLPLELIDYVLVHELAHTQQMNHSPRFWQLVANCLPHYQQLRRQLKQYSPSP